MKKSGVAKRSLHIISNSVRAQLICQLSQITSGCLLLITVIDIVTT